jgi:sigma-54 dependent transcriptional regulator, acetoin dehydrogenase operon transcriptional activator AcoR
LCRDGVIRSSNLPQEILDAGAPPLAAAGPPARSATLAAVLPEGNAGAPPAAAQPGESSPSAALREAECAALLRELERMRWNISRTAQTLGISRNTLYRKIHKHRILLEH